MITRKPFPTPHIVCFGEADALAETLPLYANSHQSGAYVSNPSKRTRISVVTDDTDFIDDFMFIRKELIENSFRRVVDLRGEIPQVRLYKPLYYGKRPDFVGTEWEFVIGKISSDAVQAKMRLWASDPDRQLTVYLGFDNPDRNRNYAEILRRRLGSKPVVDIRDDDRSAKNAMRKEFTEMAKYVNYVYNLSFAKRGVPNELPQNEVDEAWEKVSDDTARNSNLFNVMSIEQKMLLLGHNRNDWANFYAVSADEIEFLTAIEHNRWVIERLLQGNRPCTDEERTEIEEDMRRRLTDSEYRGKHPVSLKKKYKLERGAHFDLCSFDELGVDESGLSVTRYDRDLVAAIPLIVKTFSDRYNG